MRQNRNQFTVGFTEKTQGGDYGGTIAGESFGVCRFTGMSGLLVRLESILDAQNYPQSSTKTRVFETNSVRENGVNAAMGATEQADKKNKATFVVTVMYRQNATWQGTVKWVEGKQEQKFRSALELIKLMDNAVEQIPE